jgi:hypothetical protein
LVYMGVGASGGIRTRTVFLLREAPPASWATDAKMVLPASLELASPPYQSGDLPHDREERIGARSIELNVHLSRYKPEALQLSYAGMVLAAGVEPATSRLRSACTAIVLRQHPNSASPETSARVGSTGRGSAVCRGALSLKTLSFTQGISRAHPFGRERFSRTHTPSGASVRRTQIAIVDWWCCGPFGPSACYGGGVVARRRLVRFS